MQIKIQVRGLILNLMTIWIKFRWSLEIFVNRYRSAPAAETVKFVKNLYFWELTSSSSKWISASHSSGLIRIVFLWSFPDISYPFVQLNELVNTSSLTQVTQPHGMTWTPTWYQISSSVSPVLSLPYYTVIYRSSGW